MKRIIALLFCIIFATQAQAYNVVKNNAIYIPNPSKSGAVSLGTMYIGKPDTDPTVVANRKTVYVQDESGTVTSVSQPLTLGAGGIPLYNGYPVVILTDGDYSLLVKNSLGAQVYYIPSDQSGASSPVVVSLVSDLRDITPFNGQASQVAGYHTVSDGGGGPIRYGKTGAAPGTYVDNGGDIIVPTGGDGSAAWLTAGDISDPKEWGAVADGATDSASIFQAMLTKGQRIRISKGDYFYLSTVINLPEGAAIVGENYGQCGLIFNAAAAIGLNISSSNYTKVEGITIDFTTKGTQIAIKITSSARCTIEKVMASHCGTAFEIYEDASLSNAYGTSITNCFANDINYAVMLLGSAGHYVNGNHIDGIYVINWTIRAIYLSYAKGNDIAGVLIGGAKDETADSRPLYVENSFGNMIDIPYVEDNAIAEFIISIKDGSTGNFIKIGQAGTNFSPDDVEYGAGNEMYRNDIISGFVHMQSQFSDGAQVLNILSGSKYRYTGHPDTFTIRHNSGASAAELSYNDGVGGTDQDIQVYSATGTVIPTTATFNVNSGKIGLSVGATLAIFTGSGSPEGSVTASPGSVYRNTSGTGGQYIQYDKKTGTGDTGWVGVGTTY